LPNVAGNLKYAENLNIIHKEAVNDHLLFLSTSFDGY
jgi:hypothetical protein